MILSCRAKVVSNEGIFAKNIFFFMILSCCAKKVSKEGTKGRRRRGLLPLPPPPDQRRSLFGNSLGLRESLI